MKATLIEDYRKYSLEIENKVMEVHVSMGGQIGKTIFNIFFVNKVRCTKECIRIHFTWKSKGSLCGLYECPTWDWGCFSDSQRQVYSSSMRTKYGACALWKWKHNAWISIVLYPMLLVILRTERTTVRKLRKFTLTHWFMIFFENFRQNDRVISQIKIIL